MQATPPRAGPQATLCTVLTPAHVELGALNRQLTQALNPASAVAWSVAYNPALHRAGDAVRQESAAHAPPPMLAAAFPEATIRIGPTLQAVYDRAFNDPVHAGTAPDERARLLRKYLGSYHHAAGLAEALAPVATRYAIVIDPDFYVVRRNWIEEVTAHMAREDLAVFGTPWSPRWHQKQRGFPSTHLMAIDLHKAPWSKALLSPDLVGGGRRFGSALWSQYVASPREGRAALLRHPWKALGEDLRQRRDIGSARDTGYGLMQAIRARPDLKTGLVQAVFAPEDGFMPPLVSRLQRHWLVEALLPDRLRYLPRDHRTWTTRGFRRFGYPSFRERGWEEFLWNDAPFAVHVRGELHRRPDRGGVDSDEVRLAISAVLAHLGEPPLTPAPQSRPSVPIS